MNAVTIRSAAPLSIIACPAIAASAITIPMVPAVRPKPSATRAIFAAGSPGASRPTTIPAADGALGQRRAATAARTHGVARSPLDRQVDRVVGTVNDGPHIRAHRHDFQRVAWHAAGTLEHVEPGGVRRETHDLIPGAAPHA